MLTERPFRRMTLQQILVHAEKSTRDMIEQIRAGLLPRLTDFRDLSRPVRSKSHFPTVLALLNALQNLVEIHKEMDDKTTQLYEQLLIIRDHARRERLNR